MYVQLIHFVVHVKHNIVSQLYSNKKKKNFMMCIIFNMDSISII